MLYPLIRKFFFALDAETAHGIGMDGIAFLNATGLAGCLAGALASRKSDSRIVG